MRPTASTSPVRKGKQRLLTSCAIAAGLAALAMGGPAMAQVQGTGQVVAGPGLGGATITNNPVGSPNTTQVVAAGSQTIINWTPTDTAAAGAPIDFLPATNNLDFYGTGQYTVLNRFIAVDPVSGANIPISRQIALNGTVNSYVGSPAAGAGRTQGGNIWFYNAGGILIGARAAINVGSLVLTANDIDTTGGLYGANNEIRFRGATSTSSIDISPLSFIGAANPGNPGSSYVALVAPRINQAGLIDVDGSAALVAAEQADITINNGLFDINVTVGAEGGNAITHTGVTGGPSHAQGDTDQSRVYLVAIPKNDAVTMLIAGQLGYQDAAVAQTDPDGAVVLSAGYNIANGVTTGAAVGPANITIADTIFQSSVTARASGDLLAGPLGTLPSGVPGPAAPPLNQGRLLVQGNANFIGDASATLNVGANQLVGTTGNLTIQSNGTAAGPGTTNVNVTGGTLLVVGNMGVSANGVPDATTGDSTGGTAATNISGGQVVVGGNVTIQAAGTGGFDATGNGGDGTGGTAGLTVETGGALSADVITVQANGRGGGFTTSLTLGTQVAPISGNGQGGTATLIAQNGGNITANNAINVSATGTGATGTTQSGSGTGGNATLRILTGGTSVTSPVTNVNAGGVGGGTVSLPIFGTFLSNDAGDGNGGTAEVEYATDFSSPSSLGTLTLNASGTGGGANGANATGGNATGGDITIASTAGNVTVDALILDASALSGGANDSVGNNASSGNAVGGTIDMSASNGATLGVNGVATVNASAIAAVADIVGSSTGGDIAIGASGGATVRVGTDFQVNASAGRFVSAGFLTAGASTGGNIDFTADNGTISAGAFVVEADANTNNVDGASGAAQGGTIDIRASNNGLFTALTDAAVSEFSADAAAGLSAGGTNATGGTIQLIADGGTINFQGSSFFSAGGIAGGDNAVAAPNVAIGRGGSILIQLLPSAGDTSAISFADAFLASDGSAGTASEGGGPLDGAASGTGGTVTFDVQAGALTGNDIIASASGIGGSLLDDGGEGRGGTATFTQTGGTTTVNSLTIAADGFGGIGDNGGRSGLGVGGDAIINLNSGAIDAQSLIASAAGVGGFGAGGDDFDPANPTTPGAGGNAQGGNATITILGDATVTVQSLGAFANGEGGSGGDFFSILGGNADGGAGGNAVGGNANVVLASGTMAIGDVTADASGMGGSGGGIFIGGSGVGTAAAGGNGGTGQGGVAQVSTFVDTADVTGTIGAFAAGVGGNGGDNDVGGNGGAAIGGDASVQIDAIDTTLAAVLADAGAFGGNGGNGAAAASGNGGIANAGNATITQNGGTLTATNIGAAAIATGGSGATGGDAIGGRATVNLFGGTLTATNITAGAAGIGGTGAQGHDDDPANPVDGGTGGDGQGGSALIDLDGSATVNATTVGAFSSGIGGDGGGYFASNGVVGDTGNGGNGFGGDATVRLTAGDLTTGDVTADALGMGGNGGDFSSVTAGPPLTGSGTGGTGGSGQGGTASIEFRTAADVGGTAASYSNGVGGIGGDNSIGGAGGAGFGGIAQAIVDDIDAGTLGVLLDSSANGGDGGDGLDGAGGAGGTGQGGRALVDVRGPAGDVIVTDANFDATGTGGTGGDAFVRSGTQTRVGPAGGNGGDGIGGTLQILSTDGGTAELGVGRIGISSLSSNGGGGGGGRGADNFGSITQPGPDGMPGTMDDVVINFTGGDGGIAGAGIGGTVQLTTIGGTITSNGAAVTLTTTGQSGNGGDGGDGTGGAGNCCSSFVDQGGTVILEALSNGSQAGQISFGDTTIDASGFLAGRIELIADGSINMTSLTATAQGFSNPTNNDTDLATTGIFLGISDGGLIQTDGAVTLEASGTNGNPGASVGVYAQGDGQFNVGGALTVNAGDQVDIRHDFRDGIAPTIQTGGQASFTAVNSIRSAPGSLVSAGTSVVMNATGFNSAVDVDSIAADRVILLLAQFGRINVYGTTTAGIDLTANARDEVAINDATAGDDISLIGTTVVTGRLITNGTGLDSEIDGSNIFFGTSAAASVDHAEADNDFTAQVGSFTTGPNSIITGGDIDITSVGAVDLGNSSAGGFVSVDGQSILFDTIGAGTTVTLNATGNAPVGESILGNGINAGGDVRLIGNDIRINDSVVTTGSLLAFTIGGNANLSATTDGDIFIGSAGDVGGAFLAGGNINLTAAGNITTQATANGGYVGPNGVSEGYLFINAAGTANVLAGTGAATMVAVAAGTNAVVDGTTAGEDLYVRAGNTATVTNSLAGDDMIVTGTCCVIVDNVSTTGAGPDGRSLIFAPATAGGPNVWQLQTGPTDLSNVVLTASAGTIDASNAVAFDNLTATASGVVTTTNTIRSGLVTTITGSNLDLESVTAGTDIVLTSTAGDIGAIGALSAGHDLTINSAAGGIFADLAAGDDIRITASGDVSAASLLTTAGGADNESDNAGAYITTPGSITVTGTTNTVGQTRLTAGGTVDTGAITADYTYIDATGAINVTGDITSGGMFLEGASVDILNAQGNSGEIVLRATDSDVTVDGNVTTLASLLVEAAGAITVTGTASGNNFVQMTGGSIDLADVASSSFVSLTSTTGQINSTGMISAGSDVLINAATGGQLGALVAGDDVSIGAGGNVTIASISADGTNPQGEEVGSNVAGTVTGVLTVTGSTFAASDVTFNATSIALQSVQAGGAFTATSTGGPISLAAGTAGTNITLTSARDVVATGLLQSGGNTTATGRNLDLQAIDAGGDVDLTATVGTIATGGDVSGFNVTFDANGDIVHDNASLLSATNILTLTAGGNIDIGNATSGDNMRFTAGGTIDANALTAGRILALNADGAITLTGDTFGALLVSILGSEVELGDNAVGGGNIGFFSTAGDISGAGPITANGSVTAIASGAVDLTGDITAASIADLRGASVNLGNVSANGFVSIAATNGAVTSTGLISAGSDIFITTTQGATLNNLVAGDDIGITGTGSVTVTSLRANGTNPQGEEIGSNATIDISGILTVTGDSFAADDATFNALGIALQNVETGGSLTATTTGGPITLTGVDAGANVVLTSARTVTATGPIQSDLATTIRGTGLDLQSVAAGTDVSLTATTGNIVTNGDVSGVNVTFNAGGDIAHDNDSLLSAGNALLLTAGGDIDIGNARAGGNLLLDADGGIAANALTSGNNMTVFAGGSIDLTGNLDATNQLQIQGASIELNAVTVDAGALALTSTTGGIHGTGAIDVGGPFVVQGQTLVDLSGDITADGLIDITGGAITVGNIDGGGGVGLIAITGAVNSAGTVQAGNDLEIVTADGGSFNRLVAGDDIRINGRGDIDIAFMDATGTNPDPGESGSNSGIDVVGNVSVGHGEAAGNFIVNTTSFATGLNSLIVDGDIDITTTGASNLGNSTAGGSISVDAQSIAFNALNAGTNVDLNATGTAVGASGITGGQVTAGGNVTLYGNPANSTLTVASTTAGGFVEARGGALAFGNVVAGTDAILSSFNGALSVGDVTAGDDIFLTVNGSNANPAVISPDSQVGQVSATQFALTTGNLRSTGLGSDAATSGPRTFTGAGPTGNVIRVRASGAVQTGNVTTAGAAILASDLSTITAPTINAPGGVALFARGNVTTGNIATAGTLWVGDSSQFFLAVPSYQVSNYPFFQTPTAGGATLGVVTAGLIRGSVLGDTSFTSLNATGDILWSTGNSTTVGGSVSGGAVTAGGTLTIRAGGALTFTDAAAASNVLLIASTGAITGATVVGDDVDLSAATGITVTEVESRGNATLGTSSGALTFDSISSDGRISAGGGSIAGGTAIAASNIVVNAFAGDLSGTYNAGGDIMLTASGNVTATANAAGGFPDPNNGDAPTAGNIFIDADGDVVQNGSSAAGMFGINAGGSIALTGVTVGEDLLAIAGTSATLTNVTAGDDLDVRAVGGITATGARATAQGPDGFALEYTANGFTIGQGEGSSALDGSDIFLSAAGAINAGNLSAGDDIILAGATIALNGATTLGLGQTAGASNVSTQGGATTLANIDAFNDLRVQSSGNVVVTGVAETGRDIMIAAASVDVAALTAPNNSSIDTLNAGRNLTINSGGAINGGSMRATGSLNLSAGTNILVDRITTGTGGATTLNGADGVQVSALISGGVTSVTSDDGDIGIGTLGSQGPITLVGDTAVVNGVNGDAIFANIQTDVGDAYILGGNNISITTGSVAGLALIRSDNNLSVTQLTANQIDLSAENDMTLGTVTSATGLGAVARNLLTVNGAVVGRNMGIGSGDITIGANGRLGTLGTTQTLQVLNIEPDSTTYIGGTGTRDGYHIDATEMTRLFGDAITILAPDIPGNNGGFVALAPGALAVPIASVGSTTPPTVIIDDFTITAGGPTSNLGANGSLTIATQGKARVIGDAALTGMTDANSFRISADDSIEVILGEGTIRLSGSAPTTPGGMLFLESEDVIVATAAAISDVGAATTTDEIDDRLAENDGILLDDGALFAGGMDVSVVGGFYVQNSGMGTRFAQRRGLTFGPLGLNVNVEGADSRIVINGVHLGPSGQVTGLDTIPLLSINGFVIGSGPLTGSGLAFDSASTMNGCLIVSSTTCAFLEFESSFPVQDVINDEDEDEENDGEDADGIGLPIPLITMRNLDPLTGQPLLDDPVTGAGNDDLWTPTIDEPCDPAASGAGTCPAVE